MRQLPPLLPRLSPPTPLSEERRVRVYVYVRAPQLAFSTPTPFTLRLELERAYERLPWLRLTMSNNETGCVPAQALWERLSEGWEGRGGREKKKKSRLSRDLVRPPPFCVFSPFFFFLSSSGTWKNGYIL
uniref:Uncharacterized protein n=1 Tax=Molossus molossus TaxID=27622 RepID=A0A7J8DQ59_MOLMO|nr:hypothetical protein HJG59_009273 [Molossus molossus]